MTDLYKIGEVSAIVDMPIKTLRFYEEQGLIKPEQVDAYTGYRFYSRQNIERLYTIKMLKALDFTLEQIKNYNETSLDSKQKELQTQLKQLNQKLRLISSLSKQKGEKIMKPFINDKEAIGKWAYVATAESKEEYTNNNFYKDKDVYLKELYFLPQGQGYWVFDRWTKGVLCHHSGANYLYQIDNNVLFLKVYSTDNEYQLTMVFKKVDSKEYTLKEISKTDDTNLPFVTDKSAIGHWQAVDYIKKDKFKDYQPKIMDDLFIKSQTFLPTGELLREFNDGYIGKLRWTKGCIVNLNMKTVSKYKIKTINGEKYMFAEWKSGDYVFGGICKNYYVFKLVK